ncbi:MAG: cation transporting ATPase C-terminal domain-containing protein, partial [Verrucomicrobiae bacterium]|nr:cation transporting ATPase C-terminal domain-containing protein [Verrucomicrobiae bacterium]
LLVPVMAFGTIALFWWALESGRDLEHAQTLASTVLCVYQWFNGLNSRSYTRSIFRIGVFSNPFVIAGLTAAVTLQTLVVHLPSLGGLFHT